MELTLYVNQQERTVRFREVHALAAGDIYNPLTLDGVDGADTPTLELRLYRRPSDESPVAVASGFSDVPGHRRRRRATMVLSTAALSEWYGELASEIASPEPGESAKPASSMPSLAANVWLVVSDATRQWVNCVVPILLRRITPVIERGADGVSPTVEIVKDGRVTRIRITDVNGTHEAVVFDGTDGAAAISEHLADVDDPHRTRDLVPALRFGAGSPSVLPSDKATDFYVDTSRNELYAMGGSGGTLRWIRVSRIDYDGLENKPSLNGRTLRGDVLVSGNDIPVEEGASTSVTSAIDEVSGEIGAHRDDTDNPHGVTAGQVGTYTAAEIDDKITRFVAHYLTARNAEGRFVPFATHAALAHAKANHAGGNPQFFYAGQGFTPTKNDYCVVLADETYGGKTTRYSFVGDWPDGQFQYQYAINDTAFSQAQWDAINSGATEERISEIGGKADEFTRWELDDELLQFDDPPAFDDYAGQWYCSILDPSGYSNDCTAPGGRDATALRFDGDGIGGALAVRGRVLRTGDADKLTPEQREVLDGGPYIGNEGGSVAGGITSAGTVEGHALVSRTSIRKNGKEVATEEYVDSHVDSKVDEFSEWVCTPSMMNGYPVRIVHVVSDGYWYWTNDHGTEGDGVVNDDETEFVDTDNGGLVRATRRRVLRTGDAGFKSAVESIYENAEEIRYPVYENAEVTGY